MQCFTVTTDRGGSWNLTRPLIFGHHFWVQISWSGSHGPSSTFSTLQSRRTILGLYERTLKGERHRCGCWPDEWSSHRSEKSEMSEVSLAGRLWISPPTNNAAFSASSPVLHLKQPPPPEEDRPASYSTLHSFQRRWFINKPSSANNSNTERTSSTAHWFPFFGLLQTQSALARPQSPLSLSPHSVGFVRVEFPQSSTALAVF